jgi:enoyl-CoA hydratase/carnithine racemase
MTDFGDLLYEVSDGIAMITLNRPERLNALSEPMRESIPRAIEAASLDESVRVVIITGAGRGFCAGADINAPRPMADGPEPPPGEQPSIADRRYNIRAIQRSARAVRRLHKPYIAAVNGAAAGAGMDLASMADIRFAADTARFTQAFSRNGIVAGDGGCYYLPRIVGMAKALELLWTSRLFDAEEALRIGYVSRVIPAERLMEETLAFARELAEGPPVAIQYIKQLAYHSQDLDLDASLDMAQYMQTILSATQDAKEASMALRERRPPRFKGR